MYVYEEIRSSMRPFGSMHKSSPSTVSSRSPSRPVKTTNVTDQSARRRLTIRAEPNELFDSTPSSLEAKYPLLYSRSRDVDDLLLQEVFVTMFQLCEVQTRPLSEWKQEPQEVCVFHLGPPPGMQLVGGLLFAQGEFLFAEMPFIRCRQKDVRCRLEFDTTEGHLDWLLNVPRAPKVAVAAPSPSPSHILDNGAEPEAPLSPTSHLTDVPQVSSGSIALDGADANNNGSGDAQGGARKDNMIVVPPSTSFDLASNSNGQKSTSFDNSGGGGHSGAVRKQSSTASVPGKDPDKFIVPPPVSSEPLSLPSGAKLLPLNLPLAVQVSTNGFATARVNFRLEEYECISMPWVVQRFQLIEPNSGVAYGPVFARGFQPPGAVSHGSPHHGSPQLARIAGVLHHAGDIAAAGGDGETLIASSGFGVGIANEVKRAKRKAVAGEERLKVLKPALYQWCLDRSPSDLGAAITQVKEVLLYYKHTFSVVRTVRILMRSVRLLQLTCRRMVRRKEAAAERMLLEWNRLEVGVEAKLMLYNPIGGDPVDAAVNEILRSRVRTSDEYKRALIQDMYGSRQAERRSLNREQRIFLSTRYRFYIPAAELLAESHRRLLEDLCRQADSPVYLDARIQDKLRDRTSEMLRAQRRREERAQREKEERRNRIGTFGTSIRTLAFSTSFPQGLDASLSNRGHSPRLPASSGRNISPSKKALTPAPPQSLPAGQPPVRGGPNATARKPQQQQGSRAARPQYMQVLDILFDDA